MATKSQDKRITSVKAFVDAIFSLRKGDPSDPDKEFRGQNAEEWFFRGQKNSSWDVLPYIFRDENLASLTFEHMLIERAQRQNPVEFRECSNNLELLTKLQHYGLGTRLLDVTLNPLVALYFATEESGEYIENKNTQYSYREHDGAVYYRLTNGCSLQDLQIRIALAVPFYEFGKSMSLETLCERLEDDNVITLSEKNRLTADDYSGIIRILQTNSFTMSSNSNVRLIQQRGAFLLAPAINIKSVNEVKTSILSKAKVNLANEFEGRFIIPSNSKREIREDLDFFNVNEATLFPELEHQMLYIQGQFKQSVGTVEDYRQYVRITSMDKPIDYNRKPPDVEDILTKVLPVTKGENYRDIKGVIDSTISIIDWNRKERVMSELRRSLTRLLSDKFSAVDAKSKAAQIVEELLA